MVIITILMIIIINSELISNDDVKGKENANRLNRLRLAKKKKTLHLNHVFCTFPCPPLHDYHVELL